MTAFTQSEKLEIIKLVEESDLGVKRTLEDLGVPRSTFYSWYDKYQKEGYEGLANGSRGPRRYWNRIPEKEKKMEHRRGAPYHPQTQGKIERYHRTIKNQIKLTNYYYPQDLINTIEEFVDYYNNERYHESINNLKPVDVFNGLQREILTKREVIKEITLKKRKKMNLKKVS